MISKPLWKTWKPYAVVAIVAFGALWWWNAASPYATLKAGTYDCVAVYVNLEGKYELLVADGRSFEGHARVEEGKVASYSTPNVLEWSTDTQPIVRSKGTTKFHATQEQVVRGYNALACEWAGS